MKYNIEGGFDFYHALNMNAIEKEEKEEDDTNKCLITRMALTNNFVEMECGHKFNYLPLYNDLTQHMKISINGIHKKGYIVCPFCRHTQQTLLPFNPRVKPILGVNLYPIKICNDVNATVMIPDTKCEFSKLYNCESTYTYMLTCGKHYCESHKMLGMSIAKQESCNTAFLLKKQKQKKAAENKLAKLLLKKEKAEKKANLIIEPIGCNQLIKSGPRKGQICGCKKIVSGTCFRHKII